MRVKHILLVFFLIFCLGCKENGENPTTTNIGKDINAVNDSIELQKGINLLSQKKHDEARAHLIKSSQSENVIIKTESFLYLNSLETQLGNYPQALIYLEEYHRQALQLYCRAIEAEKNVQAHKETIQESIDNFDKKQNRAFSLAAIVMGCVIIIPVSTLIYYNRKKKKESVTDSRLQTRSNHTTEPRHTDTDLMKFSPFLIQAEIFKQTTIYKDIVELGQQEKTKAVKVLSYTHQATLQQELHASFKDFIASIRNLDANLTENDIKLCCLSLLPLTSFAKVLCYGSTEINIIKQRKHQIKKKLCKNAENKCFFESIFANRNDKK